MNKLLLIALTIISVSCSTKPQNDQSSEKQVYEVPESGDACWHRMHFDGNKIALNDVQLLCRLFYSCPSTDHKKQDDLILIEKMSFPDAVKVEKQKKIQDLKFAIALQDRVSEFEAKKDVQLLKKPIADKNAQKSCGEFVEPIEGAKPLSFSKNYLYETNWYRCALALHTNTSAEESQKVLKAMNVRSEEYDCSEAE